MKPRLGGDCLSEAADEPGDRVLRGVRLLIAVMVELQDYPRQRASRS